LEPAGAAAAGVKLGSGCEVLIPVAADGVGQVVVGFKAGIEGEAAHVGVELVEVNICVVHPQRVLTACACIKEQVQLVEVLDIAGHAEVQRGVVAVRPDAVDLAPVVPKAGAFAVGPDQLIASLGDRTVDLAHSGP